MPEPHADHQRFMDGLPWYMNGTISPEERAWMDAYLPNHPEAQEELAFDLELQEELTRPDPEGDARLLLAIMAQVRASQSPAKPARPLAQAPRADQNGWWRFWGQRWAIPTPAFAGVLLALVLPWWLLLQTQTTPDDGERMRSVTPPSGSPVVTTVPCTQQWRLRVAVGPDVRFDQAVLLLRSVNANVVAGPTASGEFWLRWSTQAERDQAATALGNQKEVHDVLVPPADSELGCLK